MTIKKLAQQVVERMPDTVSLDSYQVIEKEWLVTTIESALFDVVEECARVADEQRPVEIVGDEGGVEYCAFATTKAIAAAIRRLAKE